MVYIFSQRDNIELMNLKSKRIYLRSQNEFICDIKTGISKNKIKEEIQSLFEQYICISNEPIQVSVLSDRTFYHKFGEIANLSHLTNWKKYKNTIEQIPNRKRLSNTNLINGLNQIDNIDYSNDNIYSFWIK